MLSIRRGRHDRTFKSLAYVDIKPKIHKICHCVTRVTFLVFFDIENDNTLEIHKTYLHKNN